MRNIWEVPDNYRNLTWDSYKDIDPKDRESMRKVKRCSENLKIAKEMGINLLLLGRVGTGKTGLSYLILKRLLELRRKHKVFLSFAATDIEEMVEMYTQTWYLDEEKREFREKIKGVDYLIIDDIGKEWRGRTRLTEAVFGSVIRHRVKWRLPTIVTSNVTLKGLKETYGEALISMLLENTLVLRFKGEDFRKRRTEEQVKLFEEKTSARRIAAQEDFG